MNGFSCKDPYCILSDVIWDELFEPAFAEMVSEQREIIDIPPEEVIDLSDGVLNEPNKQIELESLNRGVSHGTTQISAPMELPSRSFLLRINRRRDL